MYSSAYHVLWSMNALEPKEPGRKVLQQLFCFSTIDDMKSFFSHMCAEVTGRVALSLSI